MAANFAFLYRSAAGPVSLAEGFLHPAVAGFAKGYLLGRISWDAASQR